MTLLARLHRAPILGSFVTLADPAVVEVLAWSGFDAVCVDAEHAPLSVADVAGLLRAADACGITALVRVREISEVGRVLDMGAAGVVIPRVETAEDAAKAVAEARYPSVGVRGAGLGRANRHGTAFRSYLEEANDEVLVVVQVETRLGLEHAEAIAGVPGVDLVFVGPGDLSVSLQVEVGGAAHSAAIERILSAAAIAGKPTGIFCASAEDAARWERAGARLLLVGGDVNLLGQMARTVTGDARAALRGLGDE